MLRAGVIGPDSPLAAPCRGVTFGALLLRPRTDLLAKGRGPLDGNADARSINARALGTPQPSPSTPPGRVMTQQSENDEGNRFCKACGTPAEDGRLCGHCGSVLELPDEAGLVDDQGAAVRRDLEGRTDHQR